MIVCVCISLSEKEFVDTASKCYKTFHDFQNATGAGLKCTACREYLEKYFEDITNMRNLN